jgi:ABC-type sugar transport system ATPase subunit
VESSIRAPRRFDSCCISLPARSGECRLLVAEGVQPAPLTGGATLAGSSPALEARGVSKHYGHVQALRGVDFELRSGEIHALVGDNGAGKSTLVKILSGAVAASEGVVLIGGETVELVSPIDAANRGISTVYQNLALVGCRDIAENVFLGREPTRYAFVRRRHMHREARRIVLSLRQMNVSDTHTKVSDLSGGQRQAVAIAREVGLGSSILILDEPTAALGVRESHQVLNVIAELGEQRRSILIVSHNLAHVFRIAERITVLRGGRNVGTVTRSDVDHDHIVRMITGADAL